MVFVLKAKEFGNPDRQRLCSQKHDVAGKARRLPDASCNCLPDLPCKVLPRRIRTLLETREIGFSPDRSVGNHLKTQRSYSKGERNDTAGVTAGSLRGRRGDSAVGITPFL